VGYLPAQRRFVSKDTWQGDYNNPITLVKWLYANANPVIYTDPSGYMSVCVCIAQGICGYEKSEYVFTGGKLLGQSTCDPVVLSSQPEKYPVETLSTSYQGYKFIEQVETNPSRG
jgi:hypothetical protein